MEWGCTPILMEGSYYGLVGKLVCNSFGGEIKIRFIMIVSLQVEWLWLDEVSACSFRSAAILCRFLSIK